MDEVSFEDKDRLRRLQGLHEDVLQVDWEDLDVDHDGLKMKIEDRWGSEDLSVRGKISEWRSTQSSFR